MQFYHEPQPNMLPNEPAATPDVNNSPPRPVLTSEETQVRLSGTRNLLRFLEKTFHTNDINDYHSFSEMIRSLDKNQMDDLLTRINGIANNISMGNRGQTKQGSMLKDTEGSIQYVPPPEAIKGQMLEAAQNKLGKLNNSEAPEAYHEMAVMIYNLIVYTHMFADGNGRTARLAYTLLTPRKNHLDQRSLQEIIMSRSYDIQQYHRRLDDSIYLRMLISRGIPMTEEMIDPETAKFTYVLKHSKRKGFDTDELGFISAFDAMTEEERGQYARNYSGKECFYFDYDELPQQIQIKIYYQHFQTRTDLASTAIFHAPFDKGIKADTLPWLDKAWSYQDEKLA